MNHPENSQPRQRPAEGRPHLLGLLAGLFLAAGLVASAMLVTRAWLKVTESEAITVTGSARRNVTADLVVWRGSFTSEAATLITAQEQLGRDRDRVTEFLARQGFSDALFSPIDIQELRARQLQRIAGEEVSSEKTVGFRLRQGVELRGTNVDLMLALDRATGELVQAGLVFTSQAPDFIYTQAGEAKVEMLAEATKDARARADQIAGQGARAIARLRSARMGVFQITPLYRTETSWDGLNDTSSREKTVTAVVTATFSLK